MDQRDTTQVVRMLTPDERKEMLESINSPADLRKLPVSELPVLARALRDFMVESVSNAAPDRRHFRFSEAQRKPVRLLRYGAFLDVNFCRTRYGCC